MGRGVGQLPCQQLLLGCLLPYADHSWTWLGHWTAQLSHDHSHRLLPHHRQEDDHQAVLCCRLCHRCLLRHPWGHVDAGHGRPLRRHHAHPRPCQPRDHRDCLGVRYHVVTRDFNFMFETELSVYWRVCWGVLCPLLLSTLFIYLVFVDGGPFVKVDIAESSKQTMAICGYTLAGLGLFLVPLHLLFTITADEQGERFLVRLWNTIRGGRFGGKLREAFLPNDSWGPSSIKERKEWQVYSETHSKLEFLPSSLRSRLERGSISTQELPK